MHELAVAFPELLRVHAAFQNRGADEARRCDDNVDVIKVFGRSLGCVQQPGIAGSDTRARINSRRSSLPVCLEDRLSLASLGSCRSRNPRNSIADTPPSAKTVKASWASGSFRSTTVAPALASVSIAQLTTSAIPFSEASQNHVSATPICILSSPVRPPEKQMDHGCAGRQRRIRRLYPPCYVPEGQVYRKRSLAEQSLR